MAEHHGSWNGKRVLRTTASVVIGMALLVSCAPRDDYKPGIYGDLVAARHARSVEDMDSALSYFNDALKHEPVGDAVAGEAFHLALMEGRYEMAERLARKLDASGDGDSVTHMFLAIVAFKNKQYDQAYAFADQVNGGGFDAFLAPLLKGWVATVQGQHDKALDELLPLSRVGFFDRFRREHTAHMLRFSGQIAEAELAYGQVLSSGTMTGFQSLLSYAELMLRRDDREGAIRLLKPYMARWGDNVRLKNMYERLVDGRAAPSLLVDGAATAIAATVHYSSGQLGTDGAYRPALLYARLGAYLAPSVEELHLLIGNLYLREDRVDEALRAFARVRSDGLFHDQVLFRRVAALNSSERYEEAIALLQGEMERNDTPLLHSTIGDLYRINARFSEALVHYDRALLGRDDLAEADWFTVFARGVCYEQLDEWAKAETDLLLAMSLKPDEPQVMNYLGYSWVDRGYNIKQAREMIEKAHEMEPTSGPIVDSLGWVYFLLGRYDDAVAKLEQAVTLEPNDAVITDHLGDAYWMVGRRLEARYQWERALGYDIDDDHAQKVHDKLSYGLVGVKVTREGA